MPLERDDRVGAQWTLILGHVVESFREKYPGSRWTDRQIVEGFLRFEAENGTIGRTPDGRYQLPELVDTPPPEMPGGGELAAPIVR